MSWVAIFAKLLLTGLRVATPLVVVGLVEILGGVLTPQKRNWLRSATYWVVTLPFALGALMLLSYAIGLANLDPLVPWKGFEQWVRLLPTPSRYLVIFSVVLACAMVSDFFYYWMHRAQHAWFWSLHVVHHSIEDLDAISSYHHVSEEFFQAAFVLLPLYLLAPSVGQEAFPLAAFVGVQQVYVHSPSKLSFGPLRRLLVDNRYHRIHHSTDPKHFNRNFGVVTPIWDVLFGTAYFPATDEWPMTGVAGSPECATITGFLLRPFQTPLLAAM